VAGEKKEDYINEFLQLAFDHIRPLSAEHSQQESEETLLRNRNVVEMISQFLDESEVNGIGSLKAHCSLNKGQLV